MKTLTVLLLMSSSLGASTIIEQWDSGFHPNEYVLDVTSPNLDTNDNGPDPYQFWFETGIFQALLEQEQLGTVKSFYLWECPSNADCILEDTVPTIVSSGPECGAPEPATWGMIGIGGLFIWMGKKKKHDGLT